MDIRKVKKLIELLEESGIAELEISEGEESVRISRHPRTAPPAASPAPLAPAVAAAPAPKLPATAAGEHKPRNDDQTITSPMVGTFYGSPAPEDPPFVRPGEQVEKETIVCIIEAMKVMNEVKAGVKGVIAECLVENGQPIEYGTKLFRLLND